MAGQDPAASNPGGEGVHRKLWLDYLSYLAVRIVICIVQACPLDSCEQMARWLGWLFARFVPLRQDVVNENLRLAFPQLSEARRGALAHAMWEHLFLLAVEVVHAPRKIHDTNWRDYLDVQGKAELVRALLVDRPCVLVSGHCGNFELCVYVLGLFGFPTFSIARPLDNPYLDRYLNEFRGAKGQHILPKVGSARQIDAVLESGGTLSLLGDQHAGDKGCWVDFFGRPASTAKAIALFALSNDAPLLVCYSRRRGKALRHVIAVQGLADPRHLPAERASVPGLTQWYTGMLEQIIRRAPDQYWWVHRRWKGAPPRRGRQAA